MIVRMSCCFSSKDVIILILLIVVGVISVEGLERQNGNFHGTTSNQNGGVIMNHNDYNPFHSRRRMMIINDKRTRWKQLWCSSDNKDIEVVVASSQKQQPTTRRWGYSSGAAVQSFSSIPPLGFVLAPPPTVTSTGVGVLQRRKTILQSLDHQKNNGFHVNRQKQQQHGNNRIAVLQTNTQSTVILHSRRDDNDDDIVITGSDRYRSCVPYLLPLLDGDQFGHYIYDRIVPLGYLNDIFFKPLVNLYHSIPYCGVGFFIVLTIGTRLYFADTMSRVVRYNAQQAALVDVLLIIPELIGSGFVDENTLPQYISEPCCTFVWYTYMFIVLYCITTNIQGKLPTQIPYVSSYADVMTGPF